MLLDDKACWLVLVQYWCTVLDGSYLCTSRLMALVNLTFEQRE
jgi:hypothetical protein